MDCFSLVQLPSLTIILDLLYKLNSNFSDSSIDENIGFEIEIRKNQSYL